MKRKIPTLLYKSLLVSLVFLYIGNFFNLGIFFLFFLLVIVILKAIFTLEVKYDFGFAISLMISLSIFTIAVVNSGFSLQNLIWFFLAPFGGYIASISLISTFARDRIKTIFWTLFVIAFSLFASSVVNYVYSAVSSGNISPATITNMWNNDIIPINAIIGSLSLPLFVASMSIALYLQKKLTLISLLFTIALAIISIALITVTWQSFIHQYLLIGLLLIVEIAIFVFYRDYGSVKISIILLLSTIVGAFALAIWSDLPKIASLFSSAIPISLLFFGPINKTLGAQNAVISAYANFGIIGLLLSAVFLIYIIARLIHCFTRQLHRNEMIILTSVVTLTSLIFFGFDLFANPILIPLLFLLFGMVKYSSAVAYSFNNSCKQYTLSDLKVLLIKTESSLDGHGKVVFDQKTLKGYELNQTKKCSDVFDSKNRLLSDFINRLSTFNIILIDKSVNAKSRRLLIPHITGEVAFIYDAIIDKSKIWTYSPLGLIRFHTSVLRFFKKKSCTLFLPNGCNANTLSVALPQERVITLPSRVDSENNQATLEYIFRHFTNDGDKVLTTSISNSISSKKTAATKERPSSLKYGAIISYLLVVVNIIAGLFYTPWMINELGKTDYGIYSLALSIITIFSFDFGLGYAITKYVAHYKSVGDKEKADNLMGLIYKMYLILSAVIFAVLFGLYFFLPSLYQSFSSDEFDKLKIVYVIVGFFSVVSFTFMPQQGLIVGNDKYPESKIIELCQKVVNIAAIIVVLLLDGGLYLFVAVTCAISLATILVKTLFIRKSKMVGSKPNFKYRDGHMLKMILATSVWTAIIGIGQRITLSIQPAVIGIFSGPDPVAIFALAVTIETYAYTFSNATEGMFMPRLAKMAASDASVSSFENEAIKIGRINLLIFGLIFVGIVSLGRGFISIWTRSGANNDFSQSYYVLVLILIPFLSVNTQIIGKYLMLVKDKMKYIAYSSIVTAVITTLISLFLSWLSPEYGAIFAGVGICVGQLIGWALMNNYFFHKHLGFKIRHIVYECQVKLLPLLILGISFGFGIEFLISSTSWPLFIVKVALVATFYAIVSWNFFTTKEEKAIISSIASNISTRLYMLNEN